MCFESAPGPLPVAALPGSLPGAPEPGGGTLETHMPHLFDDSRMGYKTIVIRVDFLESRESALSANIYIDFRNIKS